MKLPIKVLPIVGEDYYSDILDRNDSLVAPTVTNEDAHHIANCLNFIGEYSDEFLHEMGSLAECFQFMKKMHNSVLQTIQEIALSEIDNVYDDDERLREKFQKILELTGYNNSWDGE